jgi:oligopeptide transport system permease protein
MNALAVESDVAGKPAGAGSPSRDAWRRFSHNRIALAGALVAGLIMLAAVSAPVLAPQGYEYATISDALKLPSAEHWLGSDEVGRDFFSRVLYGARTSMTVGLLVPLVGLVIGLPIGAAAGWVGGWVDFVVLRLIEAMTAIPQILVALLLITVYGSGLFNVTLFLGVVGWVPIARLTRAQFLALRDREFVLAARATGTRGWQIMLLHILPNAAGPIIVALVFGIPAAIFGEAGLSFLGLGVQDPIPSWGKMISAEVRYLRLAPFLALVPMTCVGLTMLSFSFVGDGIRDALDPNAKD